MAAVVSRWEEKLSWYKEHGILSREEVGGTKGTVVITRDEVNGSIDSTKIAKLISEVLNPASVENPPSGRMA